VITVHVWDSAHGGSSGAFWGIEGASVGHAAMEIAGGDPAGVVYVSWWPRAETFWNALVGTPAHAQRTLEQEIAAECAPPDHRIRIPGLGDGHAGNGLDQTAMKAWWQAWQRDSTYRLVDRSCCTTIVRGLLAGQAERYTGTILINPSAVVWGPGDVVAIADACAAGVAAARY
jgi:hypothetical protein